MYIDSQWYILYLKYIELHCIYNIHCIQHCTLCTVGWPTPQKKIMRWTGIDGWCYYKMILLLLFSISSTIRASVAQKPKPIFFFHGAQTTRNAAENYKKKNRGFSETLLHNISCEFTSFFKFWSNQKIRDFFFYNFQRHSLLTALHGTNFWFWF